MSLSVEEVAPRCRETAGFLFSHKCENPVEGACGRCGKPICAMHTRDLEGESVCVGCDRQAVASGAVPLANRQGDPYFFAMHHYPDYHSDTWSEEDRAAFAGAATTEGAPGDEWERDWDAS